MANTDYNFQYTPLTGRLPGNSFVKQTEQAINELAGIVNEGAAQVEVITNLANQANDNSEEALEKANAALETSSRVYITLPNLDDADDYFESQLYYFANSYSANLPVQDTGFLEVKTNDTKTAAEQVFIADTTGLMYMRHGVITSEEVGSETVYSVTWETWSSALASEDYVQGELANYLPLSGGSITGNIDITGDLSVTGAITGNLTGNADTATTATNSTNATNDGNGNQISVTYLPLAGGTMTGAITADTAQIISRSVDNGFLQFNGGTEQSKGAWLRLNGKDNTGGFQLRANNGTDDISLTGKPDGTLTWNSKTVEQVNASGTGYIRYESGLQICWGADAITSADTEITLPAAFKAGTWHATGSPNARFAYRLASPSSSNTTKIVAQMSADSGSTSRTLQWIAVGFWK